MVIASVGLDISPPKLPSVAVNPHLSLGGVVEMLIRDNVLRLLNNTRRVLPVGIQTGTCWRNTRGYFNTRGY